MGIFRQFPYSNFHEMNMDEIIKICRQLQDDWAATSAEWASYKDYIDNYFRNLDVSEEVLAALRIFAADGTLNNIMDPVIAKETADWLAKHISATAGETVIDTSLTVAGAAADAKAAGDAIRNTAQLPVSDLDDLFTGGWYFIGYNDVIDNAPVARGQRYVKCVKVSGSNVMQIFYDVSHHLEYQRAYVNDTWLPWKLTNYSLNKMILVENDTNLNDLVNIGQYYIGYSTPVSNCPVNVGQRYLDVVSPNTSTVMQILHDPAHYIMYTRGLVNNVWSDWKVVNKDAITSVTIIDDNSDLNNFTKNGWYYIGYASNIANAPVQSGRRYLNIINIASLVLQIFYYPSTKSVYMREYGDNMWGSWSLINDFGTDTKLVESTNYSNSQIYDNTGTDITVMSYNVANFNNDSAVYINDNQITEFKKVITDDDIDIIGIQELRQWIDSNRTKDSANYMFRPVYPRQYGVNQTAVFAKRAGSNNVRVFTSTNRAILGVKFVIDGKSIYFVCAHPSATYQGNAFDSEETINARLTEYNEIVKWAKGEITLNNSASAPITAAEHDYTIIAIDSNALTATDRTNLLNVLSANNLVPANGGYYGWINTTMGGYPIDNIIVSNNITINKFKSYESLGTKLYSDHYPVIATLTLH